MSSFPARPALSVRTRLMLAAGLCALLALLPTTLLATRYYAEFSDARREARALDEMRDWLALVDAADVHLVDAAAAR
ncbi:MAG TPA: hypothetical protein VF457_17495, partial [Burkholderiaceae bacterium]